MIQQFPTLPKISKTVLSFSKVTEYVHSFPKIVKDSPRVSKENTNHSSHDMQHYCRNNLVEIESNLLVVHLRSYSLPGFVIQMWEVALYMRLLFCWFFTVVSEGIKLVYNVLWEFYMYQMETIEIFVLCLGLSQIYMYVNVLCNFLGIKSKIHVHV